MNLAPLDYVMIGVPLVLVTGIALAMRPLMRTVVDFLAAGRCAGRYLIATSASQIGGGIMGIALTMEAFSKTGVSIGMWQAFTGIVTFLFLMFGLITYRFRETRCLTFHQFFEVRYSKGMRVFASVIASISALIGFGLAPAVGARFFVYFCGMPTTIQLGSVSIPVFAVVMSLLMLLSLFFALTGGQISVMVTDCVEGLISSVFYIVIAFAVFHAVSVSQMKVAMLSGPPGQSYIDPFDISKRSIFDGWYVAWVLILSIYTFRGQAWNQGFNAAAKTAHEGKMSGIVGYWRGFGPGAMIGMACLGAFTLLHNPDFAVQQAQVRNALSGIGSEQLKTQMSMPMALGVLLGPGIKGAFCAIGLFGLLSSQGTALHGIGSTILQDVILPLRKNPPAQRQHLLALQGTIIAVAIFGCVFSLLYKPADYLMLVVTLIGAIYAGGVGSVVWGGLYWKKATTAGAWASMIVGTSLAVAFNIIQPYWTRFYPIFFSFSGNGSLHQYMAAHADACPLDGQALSVVAAAAAVIAFISVSLLSYKEDFNMDRMLHRGQYAIEPEGGEVFHIKKGFSWGKLIGIDENYTRGDKVIATLTFCYAMAWKPVTLSNILYFLIKGRQSDNYWFGFQMWTTYISLGIAIIVTIWLAIGTIHDLNDMLKTLRVLRHNFSEDGVVRNHHNIGEARPITKPQEPVPAERKIRVIFRKLRRVHTYLRGFVIALDGPAARIAVRIAIAIFLIAFAVLATRAGIRLRDEAWRYSRSIRYHGDVRNAVRWGSDVIRVARQQMDPAAATGPKSSPGFWQIVRAVGKEYDQRSDDYGLDYPPLRLLTMSLWVRHVRVRFPYLVNWPGPWHQGAQPNEDIAAPLLELNTFFTWLSCLLAFFLVWLWADRGGRSGTSARASIVGPAGRRGASPRR